MARKRAQGEGGLFERKAGRHKGKWVARVKLSPDDSGVSRRIEFLCATQAEALAKLKAAMQDIDRGRQPITKSQSLGSYLDDWLAQRVKSNRSPNTYDRYRSAVNVHINPDPISKIALSDVRVRHVHDLLSRRGMAGAQPSTLLNIRATLSAALQQAVRDERIYENPVRNTEAPRQLAKDIRFLSPNECKRLLEATSDSDFGTLVLIAIYTGMRMSELLGLTWDRIDFERNTISIDRQLQRHDKVFYLAPVKTRAGRRTIPMATVVAEKLKMIKGGTLLAPIPESEIPNLVFVTHSGRPFHRKTVLEMVNDAMKSVGLPEHGFHALRHTCASILINAGADALRVQRQLGHSSVRMTLDTYSHLFEERLQGNVALMDRALKRD